MLHSIILSSYNRPRMIRTAIQSVFAQTQANWELIVADDESNQDTLRSIEEETQGDGRVRLYRPTGTAHLRAEQAAYRYAMRINEALQLVRGDIVHYLCDDDAFAEKRLEIFEKVFEDPETLVAYGILRHRPPKWKDRFPINFATPRSVLDHNQVVHRISVLSKVPSWPLTRAADGDFFERVFLAGYKFVPAAKIVAFKTMHDQQLLEHGYSESRE